MATWDDLALGTWDQLWTWDDPDRNIDIDRSYAMGEVTLDAGELTVDWVGDAPTDLLSPSQAHDLFPASLVASDDFSRSVSPGLGADDLGNAYTLAGGTAPGDYSVNGSAAVFSMGSLSVARRAIISQVMLNSDITVVFGAAFSVTGTGGIAEQGIRTRYVDASNYTAVTLLRNAGAGTITVVAKQVVAGVETASFASGISGASVNQDIRVRLVSRGSGLYVHAFYASGDLNLDFPTVWLYGVTHLTAGTSEIYGLLNASVTNSLPVTFTFDQLSVYNLDLKQTSFDAHPWVGAFTSSLQQIMLSSAGGAVIRPGTINAVYYALINDVVETDFDVTVRVSATSLFTGARGTFLIIARYVDSSNYLRFRLDFNIDQVVGYAFESVSGGSGSVISSGLHSNIFHDVARYVWFRVQGTGPTLRLKAWADGENPPHDWTAYATDGVFATTPGKSGFGAYVFTGNTNTLPYNEFRVSEYWQGANSSLDAGQYSVGLSLDDGLPSEVTNTDNIGVNEATAELLGPIGTPPDIYFSTFRSDMPYASLPRDVAGVAITAQALGMNGLRPVRVFTGRMADIELNDHDAKLKAISAARLALSVSVQPPAVHGFYEGREGTWLIGYILFAAGLYVAPRPLEGTRIYIPLNGTTHSYIPDTNYGAAPISGLNYGETGSAAYSAPRWIAGPFTAAPDLCINGTDTRRIIDSPGVFSYASWGPGADLLSKAGYRGRIEAWVKLDETNVPASKNPGQINLVHLKVRNAGTTRYASLAINANQNLRCTLSDGTSSALMIWGDLPIDGKWHFIGMSWEIGVSNTGVRLTFDSTTLFYAPGMVQANLPAVDDLDRFECDMVIPTCEVRVSSGDTAQKAQWANARPFSPDAIIRRSLLQFEAIAEKAPREAFELLSTLAQGELAQVGFDASDRVQYLPLPYWAESPQQALTEILSTDSNLGKSFKASQGSDRVFNQVTLTYPQTYINETWVTGFQSSQLIRIDSGESVDLVASMQDAIVEVRTLAFSVLSGAALAATPPSVSNAINYITLNTAQDGSSAYATSSDVNVRVVAWDPGNVTVRMTNNSASILYVANNVSIPPFGLAVKKVTTSDSQVVTSNPTSIAVRGVRNLPIQLKALQLADNAGSIAQALVGFTAHPRTTLTSDVWADPRRTPGSLVWVRDADNTGLDASFRLTGISTTQDGSNLQQAISAVEAWPVETWGSGTWGRGIWGH